MKLRILTIAVALATSVLAQTDSKPYSRAAAEKSFRALVTAKDSDILELLKDEGLVCFADSMPLNEEDRFVTIDLPKPNAWFPDKTQSEAKSTDDSAERGSIYDGKTDGPAVSMASLQVREWENQDWTPLVESLSLGEANWHSYGHYEIKKGRNEWTAFRNTPPVFRFKQDKDQITGATNLSATEDNTTFYASKKYENRNSGTTTYEINVRLSTGRYKEIWTPDKGDAFSSVGNCYQAKEFARPAPPVKKTTPK